MDIFILQNVDDGHLYHKPNGDPKMFDSEGDAGRAHAIVKRPEKWRISLLTDEMLQSRKVSQAKYKHEIRRNEREIYEKRRTSPPMDEPKLKVELFHAKSNGDGTSGSAIRTEATNTDDFLCDFAAALMQAMKLRPDDMPVELRLAFPDWIKEAFAIANKLNGYKAENVHELRTLWCGDIMPHPEWKYPTSKNGR